jgi:hypothetical protein
MITYKDKTFCPFYDKCKTSSNCSRALTDDIINKAEIWSKQFHPTDVLICQFVDKPECFEKNLKKI